MDPLYFFLILLVAAALLVFIGKVKDTEDEAFRQNGIQTRGIIIENQLCWGESSVVRPVVQFTTKSGEVVQALDENGMALAVPRFSKGQNIMLIYNRENPHDFRIMTNGNFA